MTNHHPDSEAAELVTADEIARMLCVGKSWVYSAARAGRMPHVRLGRYVRFRPSAVHAWLAEIEKTSEGERNTFSAEAQPSGADAVGR